MYVYDSQIKGSRLKCSGPNQLNVDNLNNVRRVASRHFWNKKEKLKLMNKEKI
jgi:hypothetical protein